MQEFAYVCESMASAAWAVNCFRDHLRDLAASIMHAAKCGAGDGQQAMTRAIASQNSGHRSPATEPARRSRRSVDRSWTLSRLATDPSLTPSAVPSTTSVGIPRTVVVTGATSNRLSSGATPDLVRINTGLTFSSGRSAHHTCPCPTPITRPWLVVASAPRRELRQAPARRRAARAPS